MPYKRTRCDHRLVQLMLEFSKTCDDSFSKTFFEDWACGQLHVSDVCEIQRLKNQIRGIYTALAKMKFLPLTPNKMMFPNTRSFREGLIELLTRSYYEPGPSSWNDICPNWMNLHFLDLEVRDEEEARRFRYLTEVVMKR